MFLFFRRRVGCLYPLCITCVRCAEYTGIVADEHHSQECTGNLAQPTETAEYQERCRYQSCHIQPRHFSLSEVAEKVTEHIGGSSVGGLLQEVRYAVQF